MKQNYYCVSLGNQILGKNRTLDGCSKVSDWKFGGKSVPYNSNTFGGG